MRLLDLPQTTVSARLVAARPWSGPAHLGDLLRRALVSAAHRRASAAGLSAELLDWLDPRGEAAPGLALRVAAEGGPEGLRAVAVELRVWGAPPGGLGPARSLLLGALDEAGARGLSREQVPHAVEISRAIWGRPLGEQLAPATSGPWQLRLCSPLSLDRSLDPPLSLCPRALFDACIARLTALRRHFGLSAPGRLAPPGPGARLAACALRRCSAEVVGIRNPRPVRRDGLVGLVEFEGELGHLAEALRFASELQVGRGLSSGHGHVRLEAGSGQGAAFGAPAWRWGG